MPRFLQDLNIKPEFVDANSFSMKQKKVIAKVLYEFGWGSPTISKWLNISRGTVLRANKQPTPVSMSLFEFQFRSQATRINYYLLYQINKRIMDLVPTETSISRLVDAGNYFSGIGI